MNYRRSNIYNFKITIGSIDKGLVKQTIVYFIFLYNISIMYLH